MKIHFGTDGWRGLLSDDFTSANVRRVVAAIGLYLERHAASGSPVAIGYDRRFRSAEFAAEAAGVLAGRGLRVLLAPQPVPTPLVSWAVREQGLAGGIVITASHNPPEWNGIKLKEAFGGAARTSVSLCVEEILHRELPEGVEVACLSLERARAAGLVEELHAWPGYRAGLLRHVDVEALRRARLRVALDSMHGTGSPWLRTLFEEVGCEVVELHGEPDPGFRGVPPEPTEERLPELLELVRAGGFHLGLANDGDADRIAAADERGHFFSPQRILAVLFRHLWETKGHRGDAATAVNGTTMVDLLAERYGCRVVHTPIGFKYMGEVMLARPVVVAGEESGGIGVGAHLPERDGLLNALLLAEIVAGAGKGLRAYLQEIFDRVGYFTYRRTDVALSPEAVEGARLRTAALSPPATLGGARVVGVDRLDGLKLLRDDGSWLLIRPSGTEPKLRIYAEARSGLELEELLTAGRRLAGVA